VVVLRNAALKLLLLRFHNEISLKLLQGRQLQGRTREREREVCAYLTCEGESMPCSKS